jgi:hypothetical protein
MGAAPSSGELGQILLQSVRKFEQLSRPIADGGEPEAKLLAIWGLEESRAEVVAVIDGYVAGLEREKCGQAQIPQ